MRKTCKKLKPEGKGFRKAQIRFGVRTNFILKRSHKLYLIQTKHFKSFCYLPINSAAVMYV